MRLANEQRRIGGTVAGRPVHTFEVLRTEQLTPHIIRVVLGGSGFDTFTPNDFTDAYVKIVFVKRRRRRRRAAAAADPGQLQRSARRAAADRAHLHRAQRRHRAPANSPSTSSCTANTASQARGRLAATPGQPAYLMGPSGAYAPDPAADWHLLAGDEAALPAISAALEALPDNAIGKVFIEVAGPDDEIPLKSPPGVGVNWIYRGGRADLVPEDRAGDHAPLIAAVKEAQLAARSGAGLHPRRGAGGHAQPAALHPQGTRRGRQVGVVDLRVLAPRAHRRDLPAVEARTRRSGGTGHRLTAGLAR